MALASQRARINKRASQSQLGLLPFPLRVGVYRELRGSAVTLRPSLSHSAVLCVGVRTNCRWHSSKQHMRCDAMLRCDAMRRRCMQKCRASCGSTAAFFIRSEEVSTLREPHTCMPRPAADTQLISNIHRNIISRVSRISCEMRDVLTYLYVESLQ